MKIEQDDFSKNLYRTNAQSKLPLPGNQIGNQNCINRSNQTPGNSFGKTDEMILAFFGNLKFYFLQINRIS
jgi:hypothetical protein